MEDFVLWKPLYYTSIGMFILSIVLFPFSSKWSIITILALVTIWSRVPGFIHFVFNKMALNDLFALIVAVNAGWFIGGLFGIFGIMFARIFGPREWMPYSIRESISVFVAAASVPLVLTITGGFNVMTFYLYEGILYLTYYLLVWFFWREETGLEIMLFPIVVLFDFFLNATWIRLFGNAISNMMNQGLSSGWPIIVFAGLVVFFLVLAKNGRKIGERIEFKFFKNRQEETLKTD
jgi:hypothetical protein